jgi:hypothetical protein
MRIDGIRSTTTLQKRPARPARTALVAMDAGHEGELVESRRPALDADFEPLATPPSTLRYTAALHSPNARVLQALASYASIAALVGEPAEYLDYLDLYA